MNLAWLEIIDTAVKISLGAIVSGWGAYIIAKHNNAHEKDIKRTELRKDVLMALAASITTEYANTTLATQEMITHKYVNSNADNYDEKYLEIVRKLSEYRSKMAQSIGQAVVLGDRELTSSVEQLHGRLLEHLTVITKSDSIDVNSGPSQEVGESVTITGQAYKGVMLNLGRVAESLYK